MEHVAQQSSRRLPRPFCKFGLEMVFDVKHHHAIGPRHLPFGLPCAGREGGMLRG